MRLRRRPDYQRIAELEDTLGYEHTDEQVRAACWIRWPTDVIPPCVARAAGRRLLAAQRAADTASAGTGHFDYREEWRP